MYQATGTSRRNPPLNCMLKRSVSLRFLKIVNLIRLGCRLSLQNVLVRLLTYFEAPRGELSPPDNSARLE